MRSTILLAWLLIACSVEGASVRRIWIDTDPAIGAPWREVDDAFALVLAFHSPEVRIVGISTTYGNAGLKRTTTVSRDLVRRFGRAAGLSEASVHSGARSPGDFSQRTRATDALARALEKENLTYVALGPLTNLAAFIRQHPGLSRGLERVILVGGQTPERPLVFGPTGAVRVHDANVFKDADAVRAILKTDIPVVLAPVEASSDLVLEREQWRRLRDGGQAARFLKIRTGIWIWFWTSIVQHRGGPLFDSLAVMLAAKPELVIQRTRYASVRGTDLIAAQNSTPGARAVGFAVRPRARCEQLAVERLREGEALERGVPSYSPNPRDLR